MNQCTCALINQFIAREHPGALLHERRRRARRMRKEYAHLPHTMKAKVRAMMHGETNPDEMKGKIT